MKLHRFETFQRLPVSLAEVWDFASDPSNLAQITPPSLGLRVTSPAQGKMHPGMIITYVVRPLFGVPVRWVTEITHVVEPHLFVDEQRFGPYRFWHHQHHFREIDGGVEMRDVVHYALPRGSGPARRWMVEPRLREIFAFRRRVLDERYGPWK
ncbi:MAG TPA: SRPBCC family protein [Longimicrobiaceae bacterium]|jgi:ligand-binding SRPBCC domain-containing protein|nr:SRPBCC family protein [Longimicrobiaceae bacterium]